MSVIIRPKAQSSQEIPKKRMQPTAQEFVPLFNRDELKASVKGVFQESVERSFDHSSATKPLSGDSVRHLKSSPHKRQRRGSTNNSPLNAKQELASPLSIVEMPKTTSKDFPIEAVASIFAARKILEAGAFTAIPDDMAEALDHGMTISQAQGDPAIRRTALFSSRNYPFALSPATLREASEGLEKNFRVLQLKRLGHALNFDLEVELADSMKFLLRGFSESFTLPMIAASVLEYSEQPGSRLSPEDAAWISGLIRGSASHDSFTPKTARVFCKKIRDPNCKEILSISSGYNWHVTHLIFFRGFLIFCNRGYGSNQSSGIHVYKIGNLKNVTWTLLSKLIQRHTIRKEVWDRELNILNLIGRLKLSHVFYLQQKSQTVGNCTYISTKSAVCAALALKEIIQIVGECAPPADPGFWQGAFASTKAAYKDWNFFDKNMVIRDFIQDTVFGKEWPYKMLSPVEIQKIRNIVAVKIHTKPKYYPELIGHFPQSV